MNKPSNYHLAKMHSFGSLQDMSCDLKALLLKRSCKIIPVINYINSGSSIGFNLSIEQSSSKMKNRFLLLII